MNLFNKLNILSIIILLFISLTSFVVFDASSLLKISTIIKFNLVKILLFININDKSCILLLHFSRIYNIKSKQIINKISLFCKNKGLIKVDNK